MLNKILALNILSLYLVQNPIVKMVTDLGIIEIELYPKQAPITVSNFLKYVEENRNQDFHFYRVVQINNQTVNDVIIEVIQGGLGLEKHPLELPPIIHETTDKTGIKHEDGIISMARLEPGTASSEIFICIGTQPELDFDGKRTPDGQGFAAFGKVILGMDVVHKIQMLPEKGQMLKTIVPVHQVKIKKNGF